MARADRQDRRRIRREQVDNEREARAAERAQSWSRRSDRRVFQWRCRRGDAVQVVLDFSDAVIIEFDPGVDGIEDIPGRVAFLQVLVSQPKSNLPN
jgi:hypothetical protein